jgi:hypothetical protein
MSVIFVQRENIDKSIDWSNGKYYGIGGYNWDWARVYLLPQGSEINMHNLYVSKTVSFFPLCCLRQWTEWCFRVLSTLP